MSDFIYSIGDLVADPVSKVYGVITDIREKEYTTLYKINWNNDGMNAWHKMYWDHYEITRIRKVRE